MAESANGASIDGAIAIIASSIDEGQGERVRGVQMVFRHYQLFPEKHGRAAGR